MMVRRPFSTNYGQYAKVILKNAKSKSVSSQEWLNRQLTDPYVEKSKMMNYRLVLLFLHFLKILASKCFLLKTGAITSLNLSFKLQI